MPLPLRTQADAFPLIPDEEWPARVSDFKEVDNKFYNPKGKSAAEQGDPTQFEVTYVITEPIEIDGEDHYDLSVKEWLGLFAGKKRDGSDSKTLARLRVFCQAQGLDAPDPDTGIDLEPEDIIGAKVRVNIEHKIVNGEPRARIAGVKAPRRTSSAGRINAKTEADPPELTDAPDDLPF